MKNRKPATTENILVITEVASGELFVMDLDRKSWWKIPTETTPIDVDKLAEDCRTICAGNDSTAYLEYLGVHDSTDAMLNDERYERFIGVCPFGKYHSKTSELVIDPWHAGPTNLRLFGMEDQISELPDNVANFHEECTRLSRKLILTANESKGKGENSNWFFRISIADNIQNLRCNGLMSESGCMIIMLYKGVWDTLAKLSRNLHPSKSADTFWLYISAYELDGVYLPIPEDIIKRIKKDSNLYALCCQHACKIQKRSA
jgi:hypothetical protein